jgi:hypothetical protein
MKSKAKKKWTGIRNFVENTTRHYLLPELGIYSSEEVALIMPFRMDSIQLHFLLRKFGLMDKFMRPSVLLTELGATFRRERRRFSKDEEDHVYVTPYFSKRSIKFLSTFFRDNYDQDKIDEIQIFQVFSSEMSLPNWDDSMGFERLDRSE